MTQTGRLASSDSRPEISLLSDFIKIAHPEEIATREAANKESNDVMQKKQSVQFHATIYVATR
jgi:hypothetical protein